MKIWWKKFSQIIHSSCRQFIMHKNAGLNGQWSHIFFKYETIETHAHALLTLNILAIGRVYQLISKANQAPIPLK